MTGARTLDRLPTVPASSDSGSATAAELCLEVPPLRGLVLSTPYAMVSLTGGESVIMLRHNELLHTARGGDGARKRGFVGPGLNNSMMNCRPLPQVITGQRCISKTI